MESLPLNIFQQAMLLWEELHPYNACHVVQLRAPLNVDRLRDSINEVTRIAGLGVVSLDRQTSKCVFGPAESIELEVHNDGSQPAAFQNPPAHNRRVPSEPAAPLPAPDALVSVLTSAMNARYPLRGGPPFRWSAIRRHDADGHFIVAAYRHVVSDADGIVRLMAAVLSRYLQTDATPLEPPRPSPVVSPPSLAGRLLRRGYITSFVRATLLARRIRTAACLHEDDSRDDTTACALHEVPAGLTERLRMRCREREAGLNDALLTAMACGVAAHLARAQPGDTARDLGLGTIMSERGRNEGDHSLAVRLHNVVVLLAPPFDAFDEVLGRVVRQTRRYKARPHTAAFTSSIRVRWVRHVWPRMGIPHHRKSYQQQFPVCAGVSTVVVDSKRFGAVASDIQRYIRVAPPGPAAPMALAPTVWSGRLELGLVYRQSCLNAETAQAILADVARRLADFAA